MSRLREYTEYGSIGITWVAGTVFYLYVLMRVGRWLDDRFATEPLFLAIGMIAAIGLSFWWLLARLAQIERTRLSRNGGPKTEGKSARDRETKNKFPPGGE